MINNWTGTANTLGSARTDRLIFQIQLHDRAVGELQLHRLRGRDSVPHREHQLREVVPVAPVRALHLCGWRARGSVRPVAPASPTAAAGPSVNRTHSSCGASASPRWRTLADLSRIGGAAYRQIFFNVGGRPTEFDARARLLNLAPRVVPARFCYRRPQRHINC